MYKNNPNTGVYMVYGVHSVLAPPITSSQACHRRLYSCQPVLVHFVQSSCRGRPPRFPLLTSPRLAAAKSSPTSSMTSPTGACGASVSPLWGCQPSHSRGRRFIQNAHKGDACGVMVATEA